MSSALLIVSFGWVTFFQSNIRITIDSNIYTFVTLAPIHGKIRKVYVG